MNALDYPLPELDESDPPLFVTAAAAKEWAATLPLTNPGEVQQHLCPAEISAAVRDGISARPM